MSFPERQQKVLTTTYDFSADATRAIARADGAIDIEAVDVFNSAALATNATDYVTLEVINLGTDASGTTVIATASTSQTGGSAMSANVAFPLTVTTANKAVASGDTIGFVYNEQTTDVANNQLLTVAIRYTQKGAQTQG